MQWVGVMGKLGEQCVISFRNRMSKPASVDIPDFKIFIETSLPTGLNFVFGFRHLFLPLLVHLFRCKF